MPSYIRFSIIDITTIDRTFEFYCRVFLTTDCKVTENFNTSKEFDVKFLNVKC